MSEEKFSGGMQMAVALDYSVNSVFASWPPYEGTYGLRLNSVTDMLTVQIDLSAFEFSVEMGTETSGARAVMAGIVS